MKRYRHFLISMRKILTALFIMVLSPQMASGQIDIHSHMIPDSYLEAVKAHGMQMDEGFPIPSWNVEVHLAFMEEAGIRTSVLTMPAPQPYFGDAAESAAVCRRFNEEAAALKALHPGRFLFCAALPLPDVEKALEEARYALEVLGADGVKLASNSYGQYLGDPELEPLMAYLNSRKAVVITHPHKPSASNDKLIAVVPLASYEYLAETTRAILNMVAHDVLVRYPELKVVVPHCGSFLPDALPRFKGLLPVMVKQGYMQDVDVDANISRLYFDLAGAATDDVLESLLTVTEPSHILYGSDYPYVAAPALVVARKSLETRLASHGLDPEDVFSNNAARLFGAGIPVREYGERIVRLARIEVYPDCLDEYMCSAKEVGTVSMATEPGVIGLFSMQDKVDPCRIFILEVYADRQAYEEHLKTAHFKKYKEGTADMVKSLQLIDTNPLVSAELNKSAVR
ncbi:MAG: amidohydrolase family protein [Bacteroidales bacterium]|nr:amidohydrolase family protein [Bacteroidales bacterium]